MPGAADDAALRAAAAGYQPLPSRLTPVGTAGGVTFVDDSLSTNVLPTLAALDAFPGRRIALIVGGHDRGIDYAPLAAGMRGPRRAHLRAHPPRQRPPHPRPDRSRDPGARSRRPLRGRDRLPGPGRRRRRPAFAWAQPDGMVLLSPAAPSFGVFKDYRDRGEAFTREVRALSSTDRGSKLPS